MFKYREMTFFAHRLRPDIRLLEEGNLDEAGEAKLRLEEKQREARRGRKKEGKDWGVRWVLEQGMIERCKEKKEKTGE